ncbi:hypothetical protein M413DRAFT_344857 [Hebeloma cylindrosporum]|uniref:Uncharacterized protein n=1 Tax=Hebeloma cylindrosporum TaxID=76867 RepID=A0A0C3CPE1_HEBCY|nr:hypothetical protein M413DRAFT_344857 [Hebeloma cylindrosporum h7]
MLANIADPIANVALALHSVLPYPSFFFAPPIKLFPFPLMREASRISCREVYRAEAQERKGDHIRPHVIYSLSHSPLCYTSTVRITIAKDPNRCDTNES